MLFNVFFVLVSICSVLACLWQCRVSKRLLGADWQI